MLTDQVIFLTGGSEGIGRRCADAYAAEGASVIIAALSAERVDAATRELGPKHSGIVCDVSQAKDVEAAIQFTLKKYGRINAIHNNAGIVGPSKPVHETSEAEWDELFRVNLKSVYLTTKYGLEALRETRGSILNTSSMVGIMGQASHAGYTATKGGMNALTKSMALDYAALRNSRECSLPGCHLDSHAPQVGQRSARSGRDFRLPRCDPSAR